MKILTLILATAFITLGAFGVSTAYAHCGMCEASMHKSGDMKSCEKCIKAKHDHGAKPCKVCEQNDKRFELEKGMTKGWQDRNEKGTYHVLKTKPMTSPYND